MQDFNPIAGTKLNKAQEEAVTHGKGPLLIVAGAGTGKTTVITRRVAWLIVTKKLKPDQVLALTFTEKASGEMVERVDRLMPYGYLDLWIFTFHGFCERILKARALDIGLSNDFKLLNETAQWLLVRNNLEKFNLEYYRPLGNPTKFIHALVKHFSRCKDEEIGPEEYLEYAEKLKLSLDSAESAGSRKPKVHKVKNPETEPQDKDKESLGEIRRIEEIANAYHVYQQLLLDNNSLDFGDLINYTLKLFRQRPHILKKYQEQFKYILVDEFQDTNYAQYELVKLLAGEKKNLTVVGDDDQSVYKFRGASISNILEFKKDFPESAEIVLTENYRSCQNILDLSYNFIQLNNPNRLEAQLNGSTAFTAGGKGKASARRVQQTRRAQAQGRLDTKISKKLKAAAKEEGEILHIHSGSLNEEVGQAIKKILELKKSKPCDWSDFAILVRANNSALPFLAALKRAGVPYHFIALKGLYLKPVIIDIINYFKLLDNYHESPALFRIATLPIFHINDIDIAQLLYTARQKAFSLFETFLNVDLIQKISKEARSEIKRLIFLLEKHTNLTREKAPTEILKAFLEDTGYLKFLQSKDSVETRQNIEFLNQFYQKIKDFEAEKEDARLSDFMAYLDLELESGEIGGLKIDVDSCPDTVKVMTIHAAKGLEFKYVFIVNLVDLRFPTTERKDPIQLPDELVKEIIPQGDIHLQEERRLFYVACTRAKNGLYFTSAEDYGGSRKKKLSRFLIEAGMAGQKSNLSPKQFNNLTMQHSDDKAVILLPSKISQKQKNPLHLPNKFSYSQLAAFEKCPLQYKYNFVLHVPVFGKASFSFGQTIHLTLQKFFDRVIEGQNIDQASLFARNDPICHSPRTCFGRNSCSANSQNSDNGEFLQNKREITEKMSDKNNIPTLKELLEFYQANWIDVWYRDKIDKQKHKERGVKILKDFYEKFKQNTPAPLMTEKGFNFKLGEGNDIYVLKGKIDRVDKVDGGIEIIDYKTGEGKSKKKLTRENKEQLLIYQIAAEEAGLGEAKQLTFYYLDDNETVSFLGTKEEKQAVKEKIITTIKAIHNSEFPPKPSPLCKFCDFVNICEYRQ